MGLYWWQVSIGSGNGLVPSDNKPLPPTNVDQVLWCHMASPGHSELTHMQRPCMMLVWYFINLMNIVTVHYRFVEYDDYYTTKLLLYPPNNEVVGGYIGFTPSVRPSVRPSRLPCPLCNIYSFGWILSILATNDHYHERVCRAQWPLTLTYIFKVIWPWLRKSCPLCSVYSSGWILFIFGTNDQYY